jgi:predicted lipid-binding transport protein (Tim44 family)
MINKLMTRIGKRNLMVYASIFIVGAILGYYACVALNECPFFNSGCTSSTCPMQQQQQQQPDEIIPESVAAPPVPAAVPASVSDDPHVPKITESVKISLETPEPVPVAVPVPAQEQPAARADDVSIEALQDITVSAVVPEDSLQ